MLADIILFGKAIPDAVVGVSAIIIVLIAVGIAFSAGDDI